MISFYSFGRSSNKDPAAGRGESLSIKEHTGVINSIHFVVFITVQRLLIHICAMLLCSPPAGEKIA
jgi:hypothetical protein